jgi:acetyl-CoA synthetase
MLTRGSSYDEVARAFRWQVPERYNIGADVADRQAAAHGDRLALVFLDEQHRERRFSFREISALANRLANAIAAHGLRRGARLGVLLPQTPETAIAHVAAFKAGLISVPLFTLFGEEALEFRLGDSGADVVALRHLPAKRARDFVVARPAREHAVSILPKAPIPRLPAPMIATTIGVARADAGSGP